MGPPIRIVAFVGTANRGDYAKAKYTLGGVESDSVRLMAAALCSIAKKQGARVQGVELLGTTDALSYYKTGLVSAMETIRAATGRDPRTTEIDAGGSDEELRRLFMVVHAALAPEARPELGESEAPGAIWLDTTHGYRAQSFLGAAALSYTLSDWSRRRLDTMPDVRVFYGFYDETRPDAPQPIWDLTEFVIATRWNAALDALARFGRADDVQALAKLDAAAGVESARKRGLQGPELAGASFSARLGKAAQGFADDLTMIRLRDLFTRSSPALAGVLDATDPHYTGFLERRPYLAAPLARLRNLAQNLSATDVLGRAGLLATARLARAYGDLQQFAAQMVAIREAVITAYGVAEALNSMEPGPGCAEARERNESALMAATKAAITGAAAKGASAAVAALSTKVQEPRNDVLHAGIRNSPSDARSLRRRAQELSNELLDLAMEIVS